MTDINRTTDLAALHEAIVQLAAQAFPGVHFEFYREERVQLPFGDGTPGADPRAYVLLELSELELGEAEDPGTDQQALTAKFEANIIMRDLPADARLEVRQLAGAFAAFLRRQSRFRAADVFQGAVQVLGCYKDDFAPQLDQFQVWRVDWQQVVWLGDSVWLPGERPTQVLYSYEPLVGVPHEREYVEASGLPRLP